MPPLLGPHVRRLRQRAGLTQQQAADLAGTSVAALRDLEQGRVAAPRSTTLRRLTEALWLPASEAEDLLRRGQPGQTPAHDLWLQVLGPISLRIDGEPVLLGSTRQRLLLGMLALTANTPVSHERLIEMSWDHRPPANAAELLRTDVSRLRRRLRPARAGNSTAALVSTGNGYQLAVSEDQLDLLLFRNLTEQARQSRQEGDPYHACQLLAEAMELWRGRPLADLTSLRTNPAVVSLHREWQTTAVEYAESAIALGRHADVIPLLRRVVDIDPLHEAANAQLLLALTATGQVETAAAIFERLRRQLVEELGTDPGPELLQAHQAAQRQLGAGNPPPVVIARRRLPRDLPDFVGRAEELAWLHRCLATPAGEAAPTILSIVGPAGVGKTCLAVHFAHQLLAADDYSDLHLYADLHDAEPDAVLAVLLGMLDAAHHELPAGCSGRAARYRHQLSDRPAVILLDNATSEEQVLPLLPASRRNLVLVTSRRALALDGAQVLVLDGFPLSDAQRLLARIAGRGRVAADPAATARLVAQCGRLPLAVSLAAHRLRARPSWRIADLADRLAQAPDRLRELAAGSDLLRAVFDRSGRNLAEDERQLFRLLGDQPDGEMPVEAAACLAGLPLAAARRLLDRLADEHLITAVTAERYRLTGLLRDYARSLPG